MDALVSAALHEIAVEAAQGEAILPIWGVNVGLSFQCKDFLYLAFLNSLELIVRSSACA